MSLVARSCARIARLNAAAVPRCSAVIIPSVSARRWNSSAAAVVDPKIVEIVDKISTLTLLETAGLVSLLKSRLNIPDMAMSSFSSGPAAPAAAAAPVEEIAEEVVEEKTMFNVKLMKFDAGAKPKIIKEVKSLLGLSLVDSKKFVEAAPKMLKEGLVKEEAEKIQKTLAALGAEVVLE
ncbi:ribosomal protein L7/L12, C-terminal/adaptor protein ClpS-like protein [Peziza echinospora]|nr:ribosomal protein L7/L12, C-terminal/adaptor protein ClpS-like protein [Peziza echinospora]